MRIHRRVIQPSRNVVIHPPRREPLTDDAITKAIQRQDSKAEASRIKPGYVHVSSLLREFCPRRYRLVHTDSVVITESPSSADRIMWAIGRSVESHVRNTFIRETGRASFLGEWSCACGSLTYTGYWTHTVCSTCKKTADSYGEAVIFDHELKVAGSPDLQWKSGQGLVVVEIKSMNKREFDAMDRAKANHVLQASFYHYLMRKAGAVQPASKVIIFYGCKDYSFAGSPYKEYHILGTANDQIIEGLLGQVQLLRDAEQNGTFPEKLGACTSPHTQTAKVCPVVANCFSR